jgi:hypothetical protein
VKVEVAYCLSRRLANVDPNIETVGLGVPLDVLPCNINGFKQLGALICAGFEPTRDVAFRYQKGVPTAYREGIPDAKDQ